MTRALSTPDTDRAAAFAADARSDGLAVSLVGECATEFEGRAERSLPAGVRSVLWKPDDTVLVHGATGRDPDAWATGGSVALEANQGTLELRCGDGDAADALTVQFDSVHHAAAFDPADADAEVSGTESDLKERVLANPDLVEPGFQPRSTERETPAGPVDVYGRGRDGAVVVVELKARRVGPSAASQLERYVNALRRDLHADADVRGVLVAPEITEKTRRLLAENGLSFSPVE
ncbi:endonuclease NucS [Halobacterium sp. KA-6]|uniref:endonuclease NucS n=1 Tax=Halobacterium sp. KA-6 TaxID=2896368 RepID=UPI001E4A0FD8|nr:endonuclease NucS [Halobacterium sp. KA-6]MCD2201917.1 endonuclease NucS [Halobacterium sp. KA-6]